MKFFAFMALLLSAAWALPSLAQMPYAASGPVFPQLPPSRACTQNDIIGMWKLVQIYEVPPAVEISSFVNSPNQYLFFDANTVYGKYDAGRTDVPVDTIRDLSKRQTPKLQQYVVDGAGFVYFYQDSAAVDTQACFIVANPLGTFKIGQMLLMPPEGQIRGRLVKVYARVNEQPPPPPRPMRPHRRHRR